MKYIIAIAMAASVALCQQTSAQLTLYSNYEFSDNFTDTLGNGPNLIPVGGSGSFVSGTWQFGLTEGLLLESPLTSQDYRIEIDLVLSSDRDGSYRKIIDFGETASDPGLYADPSNEIRLFPASFTTSSVVVPGEEHTIILERESGMVSFGLDGELIDPPFLDGDGYAFSSVDQLIFFIDESGSALDEHTSGSVDAIRIFAPVPEPSSSALAVLCCAAACRQRTRMRL